MAKTTPEGIVKKQVDALLKKHNVWYYKPVSNGMGAHGIPDFICCVAGGFLAIECKATDKKRPTQLQIVQMGKIRDAQGLAVVIDADNVHLLERFLLWLIYPVGDHFAYGGDTFRLTLNED